MQKVPSDSSTYGSDSEFDSGDCSDGSLDGQRDFLQRLKDIIVDVETVGANTLSCSDHEHCLLLQLKQNTENPRPSHIQGSNQPWKNLILFPLASIKVQCSGDRAPALLKQVEKIDALSNKIFECVRGRKTFVFSTAKGVCHHAVALP